MTGTLNDYSCYFMPLLKALLCVNVIYHTRSFCSKPKVTQLMALTVAVVSVKRAGTKPETKQKLEITQEMQTEKQPSETGLDRPLH